MGPMSTHHGLLARLSAGGIRPSKRLGQNFLVDRRVARRIADVAVRAPGEPVLEIGPGTGVLTHELVAIGASVVALELDRRLEPYLAESVGRDVRLLFGDALKVDWTEALGRPLAQATVVSNLPYAITSPFLVRLLTNPFSRAVLMIQEEVADRLVAPVGSRQRGSLTLLREARAKAKKLFRVGPQAFTPRPKVTSAVVLFEAEPKELHPGTENTWKRLFGFRRKALRKALRDAFGLDAESAVALLREAGIDELARAEDLSLDEFDALARGMAAYA